MTPAEHAKVWRKAAKSLERYYPDPGSGAAWNLAIAMATAFEDMAKEAAKKQEHHE